jgi:RNA polymerase sigma-70 factor, ECF subfamily
MSSSRADSKTVEHLLERAGAGDRPAFDRLFELHRSSLRRLVSIRIDPRLRPRLDPSDIVQETHMVAYRRFQDYLKRRPMPFRLWLRKTAQQQLCDAQRTHIERRRRSLLREEAGLSQSSRMVAQGLLVAHSSPSERLQRREQQRRVANAVSSLSELDREIVIMRNVEGLTFEEISQVLDLQAPTLRQRYGRALLKLRAKLKEADN